MVRTQNDVRIRGEAIGYVRKVTALVGVDVRREAVVQAMFLLEFGALLEQIATTVSTVHTLRGSL